MGVSRVYGVSVKRNQDHLGEAQGPEGTTGSLQEPRCIMYSRKQLTSGAGSECIQNGGAAEADTASHPATNDDTAENDKDRHEENDDEANKLIFE